MAGLRVVKYPQKILRKAAEPILKVTDEERRMLDEMAKMMYLSQGVGLAAVQVGIDKRLAVVDTGNGLIKMVNPSVVRSEGYESQEEGCLSVPGASVKVKRAKKVVVSYMDEQGRVVELKAEGLLARAIQHEIDHLQGRLIIDYMGPVKRIIQKAVRSAKRGR